MNKKYQIIYADPSWQYSFSKSSSRDIENHYPTLDVDGIRNLLYEFPFEFDKDAVLYLWASAPKLKEALDVLDHWGFNIKFMPFGIKKYWEWAIGFAANMNPY